jgi:sulfate-transporting ATPase
MLAVRANERSAAGIGVNVTGVKIASFAISSFIAGIGGCLFAYRQTVVTSISFTAIGGLALLATVYLAGITSVFGGILGGVLASSGIVFLALDRTVHLGKWFAVLTGVGLIATLIRHPEGLASGGHDLARRLARLNVARPRRATSRQVVPLTLADAPVTADAGPALAVDGLTVQYGGVVAVSEVSLHIDPGAVVGLIGPNGAGKTSFIDGVTGFARATGAVRLNGREVERLPAHTRVRRGLARTFQALELYDDLTVEENISAAAFSTAREHRQRQVTAALERAGLAELRDRRAEDLSQGERQLVSIARACVSDPRVLLLDEPGAGLDSADTQSLATRIRDIAGSGTAILLVDHDISLVLGVCDYIYVLDFGELILEGDPASIRADQGLADAYLGTLHEATGA